MRWFGDPLKSRVVSLCSSMKGPSTRVSMYGRSIARCASARICSMVNPVQHQIVLEVSVLMRRASSVKAST